MENLSKRPSKGILKTSTSIERQDSKLTRQNSHDKDIKWDEMNILQTLHPPDKDYGHMKIEEPKTPYSYYAEDDAEANSDNEATKEIDPDNLADLINKKAKSAFSFDEDLMEKGEEFDGDDEDLGELTEEEKEKRKDFESKRKKHYGTEFQMVKLARKLMKDEGEEEVDEDEDNGNTAGASSDGQASTQNAATTSQINQSDDISKA